MLSFESENFNQTIEGATLLQTALILYEDDLIPILSQYSLPYKSNLLIDVPPDTSFVL